MSAQSQMMKKPLRFCLQVFALFCFLSIPNPAHANDSMFPPSATAAPYVNYDGKGFLINGKRTFIVSAGMEYARVPRGLWADRLMRLKRGGFNCVEVYNFWNFHEPYDGKFDFSGDRNLDAFLKLVHQMGMYAICRVGPYYCAEWDMGGYPVWLQFHPEVKVRTEDPRFEYYVDRFWSHLMPIVAQNQINHGGSVIMVQLENEDGRGWGTEGASNPYYQFLQKDALKYGLEVPYFFSGLHHSGDPAGQYRDTFDNPERNKPWFVTEFWVVWFSNYGDSPRDVINVARDTWHVIAYGGNGYNYYMAYGGSDFDYYNNNEDTSSYDYGSPVGESGDLRPMYYELKKSAFFSRSFQDILENSTDATNSFKRVASNSALTANARQKPGSQQVVPSTVVFLDNDHNDPAATTVALDGVTYPKSGQLTVYPHEIMPIVTNEPLTSNVTLKAAPVHILGMGDEGNTKSIVVYGQSGSPAELYFNVAGNVAINSGGSAWRNDNAGNVSLITSIPVSGPSVYSFSVGGKKIRVIAVSDSLVDDVWFVDAGDSNYIVTGPEFVGYARLVEGHLRLQTETAWSNPSANPVLAFGDADTPTPLQAVPVLTNHPDRVQLASWQTMTGVALSKPGLDTSTWLKSTTGPLSVGADGDLGCYAWYRTIVNPPNAGNYRLAFVKIRDRITPYVDGVAVNRANIDKNSFTVDLTAGTHQVSIFSTNYGRTKIIGYEGSIAEPADMGLIGPATFASTGASGFQPITNWKIKFTDGSNTTTPPSLSEDGWKDYTIGTDPFHHDPGWAWFETTLPKSPAPPLSKIATFQSVDDNGWVFLNGTLVGKHEGWDSSFTVDLTKAWRVEGPNVLSILDQNVAGDGGLDAGVTFCGDGSLSTVNNWSMHGGPGNPESPTGWHLLSGSETFTGPQFFKTSFSLAPRIGAGSNPIWRVVVDGLSHGSVWVNGHNLGRYPEMNKAPGVYIPECWLVPGKNSLAIYDEDGDRPDSVKIVSETAASRDVVLYAGK